MSDKTFTRYLIATSCCNAITFACTVTVLVLKLT